MLGAVDAIVQLEKKWVVVDVNLKKLTKNLWLDSQIMTGTYG